MNAHGTTPSGRKVQVRKLDTHEAEAKMGGLPARLRVYCALFGVSTGQVAEALGMCRATLTSRLRGDTPLTLAEAADLAVMLGCTLDDIYHIAPRRNNGGLGYDRTTHRR